MIRLLFFYFHFVSSSSRIIISGIPLHARFDDIEPLLKPYGKVEHCDAVSSKDPNTQTVHITYETVEQAQRYIFPLLLFLSLLHCLLLLYSNGKAISILFFFVLMQNHLKYSRSNTNR